MPDHFAILAQLRRPWLDDTELREAYHRATAQFHPDVAGGSGEKAAAFNAAYAVLRDPAARLKHLLELETPDGPTVSQGVTAELADFFGKIAGLRQRGAALAKKEAAAQSPLGRALLAEEQADYRRELVKTAQALSSAEVAALDDLRAVDVHWDQRDDAALAALAGLQQRLAFLAKWQAQLREDLFRLGA